MAIDQTDNSDPFAFGGWNGEPATVAASPIPAVFDFRVSERDLIEAVRRLDELSARHEQDQCIWDDVNGEIWRLIDAINTTPPQTMKDIAVKLRLLDSERGIVALARLSDGEEVISLRQVREFIDQITSDECAAGDEALFALIAEHRRIDKENGVLHAAAERLEHETLAVLAPGEVEYGFSINRAGKREPFLAKTEEEIDAGLAPGERAVLCQRLDELLGRKTELYRDRRDELVAELLDRKAAIARGLEAAGVDAAYELSYAGDDRIDANMVQILATFPTTLAGADALRDLTERTQYEGLDDHVVECYRALAKTAAAGSQGNGDCRIVDLFRQWMSAKSDRARTNDDDALEAHNDRMDKIENEIAEIAGGAVALAVKAFLYVRTDFLTWAPGAYIRCDEGEADGLIGSLLRDAAELVPDVAECASPVIHEDATLIDADMTIGWAKDVLARNADGWAHLKDGGTHWSEWRQEVNDKLSHAFGVIANTEARTERGAAIKARHATGGAA